MTKARPPVQESLLDRIADTLESTGAEVDSFLFPADAGRQSPALDAARHAEADGADTESPADESQECEDLGEAESLEAAPAAAVAAPVPASATVKPAPETFKPFAPKVNREDLAAISINRLRGGKSSDLSAIVARRVWQMRAHSVQPILNAGERPPPGRRAE